MPEYIDGPEGPIRVPDDLPEASLATMLLAVPRGQEVELLFIRNESDLPATDGAVAEVIGRVFMPRENYETLVGFLPRGIEAWRDLGL